MVHAQGGEHKLFEVGPAILAIAMGHSAGDILLLGKLVLAPDTAGGRVKVDITAV